MTVQITIEVSEELGHRLQRYQDRLPEMLGRVVDEMAREESVVGGEDERQIIALLASQPTPEQVLAIKPSAQLQNRVGELLRKNKQVTLSAQEGAELERYLTLEHLVRLAKAHAHERLPDRSWRNMVVLR